MGDEVAIVKIDVDRNPKLAASLQIRGVPTMMIFKDTEVVWRQSGLLPKHAIKTAIEEFI